MLRIYDVRSVFQINRQQWEPCGDAGWTCMDDSNPHEEVVVLNKCPFIEAYRKIYNDYFNGLYADETMFLHRPYIGVVGRCSQRGKRYFGDVVHTISYKVIYRERKDVSLDWIAEHLSAEKAIQYLKERGMTAYPISCSNDE